MIIWTECTTVRSHMGEYESLDERVYGCKPWLWQSVTG